MHLFQDVLNAKRLVTKEMSWSQQHEHRKQLIFQWRLPKKELKNIKILYFAADPEPWQKAEKGSSF